MPNNDGTEHLIADVNEQVNKFISVPKAVIEKAAEQEAERYVSSTLGLESGSFTYQLTKDQYIEAFIDKCKWQI